MPPPQETDAEPKKKKKKKSSASPTQSKEDVGAVRPKKKKRVKTSKSAEDMEQASQFNAATSSGSCSSSSFMGTSGRKWTLSIALVSMQSFWVTLFFYFKLFYFFSFILCGHPCLDI